MCVARKNLIISLLPFLLFVSHDTLTTTSSLPGPLLLLYIFYLRLHSDPPKEGLHLWKVLSDHSCHFMIHWIVSHPYEPVPFNSNVLHGKSILLFSQTFFSLLTMDHYHTAIPLVAVLSPLRICFLRSHKSHRRKRLFQHCIHVPLYLSHRHSLDILFLCGVPALIYIGADIRLPTI